MSASVANPVGGGHPHPSVSEWLGQRRHPLPEFWDSLEHLPPSLTAAAQAAMLPRDEVQAVISVPAEFLARRLVQWEYVPARAFVFLKDALLQVTDCDGDTPARTERIDARDLLHVRSSVILLYGLLEIRSACEQADGAAHLEYNTVIWESLNKPLLNFVAAACPAPAAGGPGADTRAENERLLRTLPFKFANGLRYYSLTPGERLRAAVFQPAVWRRTAPLIRRQLAPNLLLAQTDRKLVIIEETRSLSWWRRAPAQGEYGWIFTFIPTDRVVDISVAPAEELCALSIEIARGRTRETRVLELEPAVAAQWQDAWRDAV